MNRTNERRFALAARLQSFEFAVQGIRTMLASQHNARIHALATFAVLVLGVTLRVSRLDAMFLVVAVVAVWTAEAINTALEFLCDVTSPEFHPLIEKAKDVAAGAVLICATGAAVLGVLVFGPPLAALLRQF